jgi:hypothetical protein
MPENGQGQEQIMVPSTFWGSPAGLARRLAQLLAGVAALSDPVTATIGLLSVLVAGTGAVIAVMLIFTRQTPARRRDFIELVRAYRARGSEK